MPIAQTLCSSFKAESLLGVHDFRAVGGDTFRIALYTAAADLGANTTQYTTAGEVVGTGYTAGGQVLTNLGVSLADAVGFATFANAVFTSSSITARGALIYNTTPSALGANGATLVNPAVCVLDFGADRTSNNSSFTVMFPAAGSNTAIIRIS
jgi:hypothetical protein